MDGSECFFATSTSSESDELISDFFVVDNTPPVIDKISTSGGTLQFEVRDSSSSLIEIQIRFDEGDWQAVYPVDGVMDGRSEKVSVTLPEFKSHFVHIKAFDLNQNVHVVRQKL